MKNIDWKNIDVKELAGLIYTHLNKCGIEVILTGGSCATIYSKNKYRSSDLDFCSYKTPKELKSVLKDLGFHLNSASVFKRENCDFFIDLRSWPVSIGKDNYITKFNEIKTKYGPFKLLSATDCVKDRLLAYYHYDDRQGLDQALIVAKSNIIDMENIRKWSKKENNSEKFNKFKELYNKQNK